MSTVTPVAFESNGAAVRGLFYRCGATGPSPTVILCHGFPGNDRDVLGLGQRLMKEGFNALSFNYRGTWASEGQLTIANSVEDVASAVDYVTSSLAVRENRVDPSSVAVIGYSYGGGVGLLAPLKEPAVGKVACIAGGNLGEIARMMQRSHEFRQAILSAVDQGMRDSGFRGPTADAMFSEVYADLDRYDLVKHAQALSQKDVLLIGAWRDAENPIEQHLLPLFRALQRQGARQVRMEMLDADHSFSGMSGQLADRMVSWLVEGNQRKASEWVGGAGVPPRARGVPSSGPGRARTG